jgi:ADP-heptose:LPS heptosyltransferase
MIQPIEVVFKFSLPGWTTCALGDAIAWLPAIRYVAENYPWVRGHLIIPEYLVEIATNVMRQYPHWRIHKNTIPDRLLDCVPLREQMLYPNATMMSLVDLGFLLFNGIIPDDEKDKEYLQLDLSDAEVGVVPGELSGSRYVVITPYAEALTRKMPGKVINEVSDYLLSIGRVPVYLGKTQMGKREISLPEGADLSKGLDLTNRTSLLVAAKIMQQAEMVLGIDNGLLHLAGMTDATILYGYTIAGPKQRRIPRPHGITYELYGDKEKVKCLFCQEKMRFHFSEKGGHSFTTCMYQENTPACIRELNSESWISTIDLAIKESSSE